MVRPESTMVPVSRYGSDPNSSAAPFNFCVCGAASCITGLFLQAGESAPYTSRLFLRAAVHFARFLARAQFRARKTGKCTSNRPPTAFLGVHFGCSTAGRHALRLLPCTSSHGCRNSGEVHGAMQGERESAARPLLGELEVVGDSSGLR